MKYPYDIISYVRKKTFSVEAHFSNEVKESPLKIFDEFSRFVFCVIADGKAVTCNIHIEDYAGIKAATEYAYNKHMDNKNIVVDSTNEKSIAFTTRFVTGTYKGKSPVDILLENGDAGKKILNDQYIWLKENLSKYPNNNKLMEAIVEASKIDLSNISNSSMSDTPIVVFDLGCRPLVRKQREDGKCFCYEAKVIWDSSKNYPVSVLIKNYYAPVEKKENGLLNVKLSGKDKTTEISNEFNMSAEEWLNVIDTMGQIKNSYYILNLQSALNLANEESKKNREQSKA